MKSRYLQLLATIVLAACVSTTRAEVNELRVPLGAGGFGFLPLHIMKSHNLIEKHAEQAGVKVKVNWSNIGGPAGMIDALLA